MMEVLRFQGYIIPFDFEFCNNKVRAEQHQYPTNVLCMLYNTRTPDHQYGTRTVWH